MISTRKEFIDEMCRRGFDGSQFPFTQAVTTALELLELAPWAGLQTEKTDNKENNQPMPILSTLEAFEPWHLTETPGRVYCLADYRDMQSTTILSSATCMECLRIAASKHFRAGYDLKFTSYDNLKTASGAWSVACKEKHRIQAELNEKPTNTARVIKLQDELTTAKEILRLRSLDLIRVNDGLPIISCTCVFCGNEFPRADVSFAKACNGFICENCSEAQMEQSKQPGQPQVSTVQPATTPEPAAIPHRVKYAVPRQMGRYAVSSSIDCPNHGDFCTGDDCCCKERHDNVEEFQRVSEDRMGHERNRRQCRV